METKTATGPYQSGLDQKFSRDEVSRNAAEAMPLEELKELVNDYRQKVEYMEKNNEPDNELVQHSQEHLKMLEEVLVSRTEKE